MKRPIPGFPIVCCIVVDRQNNRYRFELRALDALEELVAVSDWFTTAVDGLKALREMCTQVGRPLTHAAVNAARAAMEQHRVPLGIGILGAIMLPFVVAARAAAALVADDYDTGRDDQRESKTPTYDVKLTPCEGHKHVMLFQNDKKIAEDEVPVTADVDSLRVVLLRWGVQFRIPAATVEKLEQKLPQIIAEALEYTLGLDFGNEEDGMQTGTMLILYCDNDLVARRSVENPIDVFQALNEIIESQQIPASAHADLFETAVDIAYQLPEPEAPEPNYTVQVAVDEGDVVVTLGLSNTGLGAMTRIPISDELLKDKVLSFVFHTLPVGEDSLFLGEVMTALERVMPAPAPAEPPAPRADDTSTAAPGGDGKSAPAAPAPGTGLPPN